MLKSIINSFAAAACFLIISHAQAAIFKCPTLKPHELYFYYDWIDNEGNKSKGGEWNQKYWRLWIHGDSYLTPRLTPVYTRPLAVHFSPDTHTWYLKCMSADYNVSPRNNVWTYVSCQINSDNTGFECK